MTEEAPTPRLEEARRRVLAGGLQRRSEFLMEVGALRSDAPHDWERLARDLLRQPPETPLWDGRPLSECSPELQQRLNEELTRVDRISHHITTITERAERDGASWGQIGRACMNNLSGFFGLLINCIGLLFNAVVESLSGGPNSGNAFNNAFAQMRTGFRQLVAPIVANDIGRDLSRALAADPRLRADSTRPPTREEIEEFNLIGNTVNDEVRRIERVDRLTFPTTVTNTNGHRNELRSTYRNGLLAGFGLAAGENGTYTQLDTPTDPQAAQRLEEARQRFTRLRIATGSQFDLSTEEGRRHFTTFIDTATDALQTASTDGRRRRPDEIRILIEERLEANGVFGNHPDGRGHRLACLAAHQITVSYLQRREADRHTQETRDFITTSGQITDQLEREIRESVSGQMTQSFNDLLNTGARVGNGFSNMASTVAETGTRMGQGLTGIAQATGIAGLFNLSGTSTATTTPPPATNPPGTPVPAPAPLTTTPSTTTVGSGAATTINPDTLRAEFVTLATNFLNAQNATRSADRQADAETIAAQANQIATIATTTIMDNALVQADLISGNPEGRRRVAHAVATALMDNDNREIRDNIRRQAPNIPGWLAGPPNNARRPTDDEIINGIPLFSSGLTGQLGDLLGSNPNLVRNITRPRESAHLDTQAPFQPTSMGFSRPQPQPGINVG